MSATKNSKPNRDEQRRARQMAKDRNISYLSALQEVQGGGSQHGRTEYTPEMKQIIADAYPMISSTPEQKRKLTADLIADGRVIKILQGDQDLKAGQTVFTVIGHAFESTDDGTERLELRALESWSPTGTSSGKLDPAALPLTYTFERPERAALLAARIAYLDEHYFPGFGPLIARVTVNADCASATLLAVLIHETAPEQAREQLAEGLRPHLIVVEMVPAGKLQPEEIEPGPVTDSEVEGSEARNRLYNLASRRGAPYFRHLDASNDEQVLPDDPGEPDPISDALNDALSRFPTTYQEVMKRLHGLGDEEYDPHDRIADDRFGCYERSPHQVGEELGLSRERVRMIEREVIEQLRADPQFRELAQSLLGDEPA